MTPAELHKKLDEALDLLADAELRYAEEQRYWRDRAPAGESTALADMRAQGTKAMRDAMADWQLAHQRIQSYAAAAVAKDLAAFLRPEVELWEVPS